MPKEEILQLNARCHVLIDCDYQSFEPDLQTIDLYCYRVNDKPELPTYIEAGSTPYPGENIPVKDIKVGPVWYMRVVIKTRPADRRAPLEAEYREHLRADISSCQFIRPLLDIIPDVDNSPTGTKDYNDTRHGMTASQVPAGLVFQWMEHNLYHFDPRIYRRDYVLAEAVATGVLQALVPFENSKRVNSDLDIKPHNFLINCHGSCTYEAKLSDLGESNYDGFSETLTGSLLTRAPEVWEGKGYFHSSDLWALGVTLFEQFNHAAFRFPVLRDDVVVDTIMLAKLVCLFPEWRPSPVECLDVYGQSLGQVFADARLIRDSITVSPLDQQLQQMDIREEWKRFLLLLTFDRNKRYSALEVLQSPEYEAILKNKP
ncbi:serine/threonine protein kinase [Helicocarpus griseus UAMH5409]|uniref:Autophagy-related protein 1 n=1 Tax=Helicocarpus griseus UAMH5409 TaxID=1447875 RepID=A0A2B7X723_9EURO|nr:serine/threonine protein kinase [Helicocarpus griseus UAMH5409]